MENDDIKKIFQELKDLNFINQNRELRPLNDISCEFTSQHSVIHYSPKALKYLDANGFRWIALHEEAHIILLQKHEERGTKLYFYWFLCSMLSYIVIGFLFQELFTPKSFHIGIAFLIGCCIFFFIFFFYYVNKVWYPEHWFFDEFRADRYALDAFFIINPDVQPHYISYSTFQALKNCGKDRKIPLRMKIWGRILQTPHPSEKERITVIRKVYENYSQKRKSKGWNP